MASPPADDSDEARDLDLEDYRALAEWRYQLREFLVFSESVAREAGLEPQHHQMLLAIRGLPLTLRPTVGVLAQRMCLRHNSVVELIDRLEERGLVRRQRSSSDRRIVELKLTVKATRLLRQLSLQHRRELQIRGPALIDALAAISRTPVPR